MKSPFSRFFGSGEKEIAATKQTAEQYEEVLKIPLQSNCSESFSTSDCF